MKRIHHLILGLGAMAMAASVLPTGSANAESVADFYKGRTLTILIGHPPGGSYDLYAQVAAQHIGKFIPGNPNVIVEHRTGGGGGLAATYLFAKAPTDGSMIALLPETLLQLQLMDPKRSRWDMAKVKYIGSFADSNTVFGVRKDAPATTFDAMKKTTINVGCSGRASTSSQMPLAVKNLAGLKFNMICGYRGSAPFMLALERGEVDMLAMNYATWAAKLSDQIKSGQYKLIAQAGINRNPDIKDVPLVQELLGDKEVDAAFRFLGGSAPIGRALFGAPGMPDDRIAALRASFDKMVKDPAVIADIKKRKAQFDPTPGAKLDGYKAAVLNTPKDVVATATRGVTGWKANCPGCDAKAKKN